MKKFIVAVCCMLTTTIAMGADPERYREPKISDFADQYLHSGSNTYTYSITSLYPNLTEQLKSKDKPTQNGTYDDEGAIIIWAAREIYEHGVRICPVQIQAANANWRRYIWLDYHWKDEWACKPFCHKNYSGNKCQDTTIQCPQGFTASGGNATKGVYNLPGLIDDQPKDKYQHTRDMQVLSYTNEKKKDGGDDNGVRQANHVVLGVTGNLDYGVRVSPIKIIGERQPADAVIDSWIVSAYSNGDSVLLCRDGRIPNSDNTKCIKNPECNNPSVQWDWCNGYSHWDAEQYVEQLNVSDKCKEYRCAADNYGFKSDKDHTCVPCETGKKSGIFVGVCTECKVGQIFNDEQGCVTAKPYDQEQMKKNKSNTECWLETNAKDFMECVTNTKSQQQSTN